MLILGAARKCRRAESAAFNSICKYQLFQCRCVFCAIKSL